MTYSFDVQDAVDFGDRAAILIYNLKFWLRKNRVDGRNQHEIEITDPKTREKQTVMRTWTYTRREHRETLFPFWSERQYYLLIDKLVIQGVLLASDRFNKMPQDRTKWLAFRDEEAFLELGAIDEKVDCTPQNGELRSTESGIAIHENVEAIPDEKPVVNAVVNTDGESSSPCDMFLTDVNRNHGLKLKATKAVKKFYHKLKDRVEDLSYLMDHIVGAAYNEYVKRGEEYQEKKLEHFVVSILRDNDRIEDFLVEYRQSEQRRHEEIHLHSCCPRCGASFHYNYCIECGYLGWEENDMTAAEHQLLMWGFWRDRDKTEAEKFMRLLKQRGVDVPQAVLELRRKFPTLKNRFEDAAELTA